MRTQPERLVYILVTLLAISVPLQSPAQNHQRYRLYDLGPGSGIGSKVTLANSQGDVVGGALTSTPNPDLLNPNPLWGPTEFTQHAFRWRNGNLSDLGTLPGGNNSGAVAVNESGAIVGLADNGVIDPVTGFPEAFGVLWSHGGIQNLGALGGNQSFAVAINNRGQVTGMAENDVPDPFSLLGGTEAHAFLWQRGVMRDLGTLGGPDSWGLYVNEKGQVAGFSFASDLSVRPFLWTQGEMIDLGSFGGTSGLANALNNRGQVAGSMSLQGDLNFHPFLWDRGTLVDLDTLGGENANGDAMNDAGEVVGEADTSIPCTLDCDHPQVYRPYLWRHGVMTDLGVAPGDRCGNAYAINARTQIVGANGHCHGYVDAFLWENESIYNLNDLVGPAPLHFGRCALHHGRWADRGYGRATRRIRIRRRDIRPRFCAGSVRRWLRGRRCGNQICQVGGSRRVIRYNRAQYCFKAGTMRDISPYPSAFGSETCQINLRRGRIVASLHRERLAQEDGES